MQLELYFTRIIKQCMPWTQANFTETDQTNCSDAIVKQSVSSKMVRLEQKSFRKQDV